MTLSEPRKEGSPLPILMCTIACRDKLLDYALHLARKLGFDGVEVWGREPHVPEKFDENRMRATRKLLDSLGVVPHVLGSYLTFGRTRTDGDLQLSDTLHVARWLKTQIIRVWASDVSSRDASPELWQRTVREAQEACDRAAKLDMTLVVEMHAGTLADTTESALRLVEDVGKDNFRLNFQVCAHDNGERPEDRLRATLPWVAHVHAQNYRRLAALEGDPVQRAPLSAGVIDYRVLVYMLREFGYQGCIAVEFAYDETGDKEKVLGEDLAFLREICT